MKAAVYYEDGGPEVLKYEDVPDPACPPDGVVVRVEAVSVEGGDVISRMAEPPPTSPYVGGYQAAGEIVEVGPEVDHLGVGQMVTTVATPSRAGWRDVMLASGPCASTLLTRPPPGPSSATASGSHRRRRSRPASPKR